MGGVGFSQSLRSLCDLFLILVSLSTSSMNQPERGHHQATTTRATAEAQSSTGLAQKILAKLQASAAPTVGIANTFNNCYASSVFQAMAHVTPIVGALGHAPSSSGATSRAILELLYNLHFGSEPASLDFVFTEWERESHSFIFRVCSLLIPRARVHSKRHSAGRLPRSCRLLPENQQQS